VLLEDEQQDAEQLEELKELELQDELSPSTAKLSPSSVII
jgi:hypothetical protein